MFITRTSFLSSLLAFLWASYVPVKVVFVAFFCVWIRVTAAYDVYCQHNVLPLWACFVTSPARFALVYTCIVVDITHAGIVLTKIVFWFIGWIFLLQKCVSDDSIFHHGIVNEGDSAILLLYFLAVFFLRGKRVNLAFWLIFSSNKGYLSSDPLLLLGFLAGLMVCLNYFYNLGPFGS